MLTSAVASGTDTIIRGTLNSTPLTDFSTHYYLTGINTNSRLAEGQTPLGFRTVTTDSNGNADVSVRISLPLPGGQFITALATNAVTNDTSEFSPGVPVTGFLGQPDLRITKSAPERASCGGSITYTITVTNAGTAAAFGVNVIDPLPVCLEKEVELTTSQGSAFIQRDFFNSDTGVKTVFASLRGLGPGASATITIKGTLTKDCGETISNKAFTNEAVSSMSVVTMVDCVKITRFIVNGKDVFVQGTGFKKGDIIEINGEERKTKFIDENTLKVKKGKTSLLDCDRANPGRMNVLTLRRPDASGGAPILDTQAFATCP